MKINDILAVGGDKSAALKADRSPLRNHLERIGHMRGFLPVGDIAAYARFITVACNRLGGRDIARQTSHVGVVTVRQFEGGRTQPHAATVDVMQRALETAGIEFIP